MTKKYIFKDLIIMPVKLAAIYALTCYAVDTFIPKDFTGTICHEIAPRKEKLGYKYLRFKIYDRKTNEYIYKVLPIHNTIATNLHDGEKLRVSSPFWAGPFRSFLFHAEKAR